MPLEAFRAACRVHGRELDAGERRRARAAFLDRPADATPVEGPWSRIAVCGGVYSNHLALAAFVADATARAAAALYCLGDLGGCGPNPDRTWPVLERHDVRCIQGNYEEALVAGSPDCNCGYVDPRDRHFAELAYRYTDANTAPAFRSWMAQLPRRRRVRVGSRELLLVHGSPRRSNEFLFHSTTPVAYLETLLDQERADGLLVTHTGLHWHRRLPSGRDAVNVGVLGRPANDGRTAVWYAVVAERARELAVELVPLTYDHQALAAEMRAAALPEEFVEPVLGGWWTTGLEILPAKERGCSRR